MEGGQKWAVGGLVRNVQVNTMMRETESAMDEGKNLLSKKILLPPLPDG